MPTNTYLLTIERANGYSAQQRIGRARDAIAAYREAVADPGVTAVYLDKHVDRKHRGRMAQYNARERA